MHFALFRIAVNARIYHISEATSASGDPTTQGTILALNEPFCTNS